MSNQDFNYDANQLMGVALAAVTGFEIGKQQAESIANQTIANSEEFWQKFTRGFNTDDAK